MSENSPIGNLQLRQQIEVDSFEEDVSASSFENILRVFQESIERGKVQFLSVECT